MTLTLVFRIHTVLFALLGVVALFTPEVVVESFNVGENAMLATVFQGMSLMMLAMAYISWQIPVWAGDNLKSAGMFFAVFNLSSVLMTLFHHFTGDILLNASSAIGNLSPSVILMILFYWKSR